MVDAKSGYIAVYEWRIPCSILAVIVLNTISFDNNPGQTTDLNSAPLLSSEGIGAPKVNKDGENLTTTRTITITKKNEEDEPCCHCCCCMGASCGHCGCGHCDYCNGTIPLDEEAAELRRQQYALENPPVHTCKPSYRMQQARILSAMKSAWND